MGSFSIWHWVVLLFFYWPVVHVLVSQRSSGGAKVGWTVITILLSYLGWAIFLIATQKNRATPPST